MRSTGPLIPRRRFGGEMKRLREARGETLAATAKALLISTSKLSRIENGQGELSPRDVRDLLDHFAVSDTADGDRLRRWAEQSRVPGWWQDGGYRMPRRLDTFIAYENAASYIEGFVPNVVPGTLQTPGYARATLRRLVPSLTDAELDEQVELRMERRAALAERDPPPKTVFAIPESVLHVVVGSPEVMREQLDALHAAYDDPSLDLRIVPFSAGLYPAMEGGFVIFRFADERDPDVVALETVSSTQFIDAEDQVRSNREKMQDLQRYWLGRTDSREFIRRFRLGLDNRR